MKTNRTKNQEHDRRQDSRTRPKQSEYDFTGLEAVMHKWVQLNEQTVHKH